jgi:uncharacterized OB-fold protein
MGWGDTTRLLRRWFWLVTDDKAAGQDRQYGDPLTAPFWDAAKRYELIVQRCSACGHYQFFPRPFCCACSAEHIEWVIASGMGTVVSKTTVRLEVTPEWRPPYVVAVVQLQEGPTLLTNIVNGDCQIGSRVKVAWRERSDAPPFPVFEPA